MALLLSLASAIAHAETMNDAASRGDVAAITAMLAAGAPVNPADSKRPPLYHAVRHKHFAAAKLLIEHGADVNASIKYVGPILLTAAEQDSPEIIALLLENGADTHATYEYETALHIAAKRGCLACVKTLVAAGADLNSVVTGGDYARSPLHLATLYEHPDVVDFLMASGVVFPKPNPTLKLLASAQPEKGKAYFEKDCAYCHDLNKQVSHKRGPNLWNVVGRERASFPGQLYSKALRRWKGTWTYDDLNYWIGSFAVGTPGVMMEIPGVADDQLRADIIAFLRLGSDTPMPLP
jgi:cytochrome c